MKFDVSLPLLGFENVKQVELQKIDDVFMKMKATEDEHISFTLVNPFVLREYDFEVPVAIQKLLEIDEQTNVLVLNIVLIQTPIEDSVVNFAGPLVFNTENNKVAQVILPESSGYMVAQRISDFLNKEKK